MRPRLAPALFVFALISAAPASRGDEPFYQSLAIFPAEKKHNHASCVIELANGDLLTAWYRGSGERSADDVEILGAWLRKGEVLWGPRFKLADTPGYPDCNPAVFAAPDKTVWLFWPTILDHHWEGALLKFATAKDDGNHFGPIPWTREGVLHVTPRDFPAQVEKAIAAIPQADRQRYAAILKEFTDRSKSELYQRLGWMPRVHPTVLKSGRWLLPLYCDTYSISIVLISDDSGATWQTSGPRIGFGNIQPSLVARNDGSIVAFMRENGPRRRIRLSESKDSGQTWGPVTDSTLPNPGAGVEAIRLANGHWALVYNDTERGRHSLALSVSDDEGATWRWTRHVERQGTGLGSFHYPSILQTRDGLIHVTYTHSGSPAGSTIQHAKFNEDWVKLGDGPGR